MTTVLALPQELTIYQVTELRAAWLQVLERVAAGALAEAEAGVEPDAPLHVDASQVAEVDAAGVQLLLALSNSVAASGRSMRLAGASTRLIDACTTLGAGTLLAAARAIADQEQDR